MKKGLRELDEKRFEYTCINSKQNALKVYMNSFYGEMENSNSLFFFLHLAGRVTSAGRNIRFCN